MVNKKINKSVLPTALRNYKKIGIVAAIVVVVAALGFWGISAMQGGYTSVGAAVSDVTADAARASDLNIAVVRMDKIQSESKVLTDLRKQRDSYETKLRDELTRRQKELEKEKVEIEKSQDVLSREALQRRAIEYQQKVAKLQQDLTTRAGAIEASFQDALNQIQSSNLDPIIERIIEKKNLSLVIDGRFARIGNDVKNLDITDDVISALNKRIAKFKMKTPKGF
ncbi:MAG: OmpH family outer membrane protein [Rickettsiales bacterium]|jgi:Skp family chaperone for outer membrane proteins|nr:OmpH family outer membrane protein [Rickettsiales bacterium]